MGNTIVGEVAKQIVKGWEEGVAVKTQKQIKSSVKLGPTGSLFLRSLKTWDLTRTAESQYRFLFL